MPYFDQEFLKFFKELAANNNRDWFHENKKRYQSSVREPFKQLVGDLIQQIKKEYDPKLDVEVKNCLFRINRDIRFSKDKTPYNLHMSAVISRGGRKNLEYPGLFFRFDPGATSIGGGLYKPDKEDLYTIRETLTKKHKKADKILKNTDFLEYFPEGLLGEKNKIIPKEFKEAAAKHPLIFNKQFYVMREHPPQSVEREDLIDFIMEHYAAMNDWNQFLIRALKLD